MIFIGEKTIFLKSILWIVFFCNFSLTLFSESKGEDEINWEKYKVEKSEEDSIKIKLKKQGSNFESKGEDEINWDKYEVGKSKKDYLDKKQKKQDSKITKTKNWRDRILRFSFEEIAMPDEGARMGLYGIGAYERFNPWLYGGITADGAATGRRGGFFTGGYTLGMEGKLTETWTIEIGG